MRFGGLKSSDPDRVPSTPLPAAPAPQSPKFLSVSGLRTASRADEQRGPRFI